MEAKFTDSQRRALAVSTAIALLFAAYFLRDFFVLIVIAAIAAYLFTPLFNRFRRRMGTGASATLTLLSALAIVIVPVSLLVALAVVQISNMVQSVADWVGRTDLSTLGQRMLDAVNDTLARVPFIDTQVSLESMQQTMTTVAQRVGGWLLHVVQGAAGTIPGMLAGAVIFLYVFVSLLVNREKVQMLVRQLNPLGIEVTDLYLAKMGAMVKGTVGGQFVIALCQGVAGAASIYVAGFHSGFFIFAIMLTLLSIIPLGGGIVTIPFGAGMIIFGNVVGGAFVIIWHLVVVTNIDNFLRPILVPKEAKLDPALMLLAVFAGIGMFGFWGIVIGPVLMIVVVTTISVYLAEYRGVPMAQPEDDDKTRKKRFRFARKQPGEAPAEATATAAAEGTGPPASVPQTPDDPPPPAPLQ